MAHCLTIPYLGKFWTIYYSTGHLKDFPHTQGVFEVCEERGLTLVEIGEGVGVDDIRAATGASFQVHNRG